MGGEMSILFDTYKLEWIPDYTPPHDLSGNPVCKWIIDNAPEARKDAKFYAYDTVYTQAYHAYSEDAGNTVRKQVETFREPWYSHHESVVYPVTPSPMGDSIAGEFFVTTSQGDRVTHLSEVRLSVKHHSARAPPESVS